MSSKPAIASAVRFTRGDAGFGAPVGWASVDTISAVPSVNARRPGRAGSKRRRCAG